MNKTTYEYQKDFIGMVYDPNVKVIIFPRCTGKTQLRREILTRIQFINRIKRQELVEKEIK